MPALMKVKVEHQDGSRNTYRVLPKTVVAFERNFGIGVGAMATMEHTYWLAWDAECTAIRGAGGVTKLFDDWIDGLESVEVEADAAPLAVQSPSPAS